MTRRDAQLARLGEADFTRLWKRIRRKVEGQSLSLEGRIGLPKATPGERRAVEGLMGRALQKKRISISLKELDERLKKGPIQEGLLPLLIHLGGPLRDKQEEERQHKEDVQVLRERIQQSSLASMPWLPEWLSQLDASGTLSKMAKEGTQRDLHHALGALEILLGPAPWRGHIATLGALVSGDTKRLAKGAVSTLVLGALAAHFQVERPGNASERRHLWERAGVIQGDLASQVLLLGLRSQGADPLSQWLEIGAREGEPLRITLHQLKRYGITPKAAGIYICENPAVLRRAALELGPQCPPVLCTEGQPGAAFQAIAEAAREKAIPLYYHGDFDWPGVGIAGHVIETYGALPWRMGAGDYTQALERLGEAGTHLLDKKAPIPTPWDPALQEAMVTGGRAIFEEAVLEALMEDLKAHSRA